MTTHDKNDPNREDKDPQDQQFGMKAAEDVERVERGEAPKHDGEVEPNASGKAEKASRASGSGRS